MLYYITSKDVIGCCIKWWNLEGKNEQCKLVSSSSSSNNNNNNNNNNNLLFIKHKIAFKYMI